MAKLGRDGTAGSTGGSRAFINSAKRVRKNTNAVSGVAKADSPTSWKTGMIQRNSVKPIVKGNPKSSSPTKNELGIGDKKGVERKPFSPKKVVAKKNPEVEIQGKMYKTGGPAEKKMAELRKLQTANTVAKRATAPKRMK